MMIICWLVFLTGCGANELENHAFPLALGVEKTSEDDLEIYMAYPDLQDDKAAENALSSDVFWNGKGQDLFTGKEQMSANSNKKCGFQSPESADSGSGNSGRYDQDRTNYCIFFRRNRMQPGIRM